MTKIQNTKHKSFRIWRIRILNLFRISDFGFRIYRKEGIALLLTVFILTAVFSISIGVFNVLYGEILITGAVENSFQAINASDVL